MVKVRSEDIITLFKNFKDQENFTTLVKLASFIVNEGTIVNRNRFKTKG